MQYRGFTITRLTEDAGLRQYLVQPPIRNGQEAYRTLTAAYKAISATQRRAHLVVPRR